MGEISITVTVTSGYLGKREISSYEITEPYGDNPAFMPQRLETMMARVTPLAVKSAAVVFGDARDTGKK